MAWMCECGARMYATDTRTHDEETVRRKYKCNECGARIVTHEHVWSPDDDPEPAPAKLAPAPVRLPKDTPRLPSKFDAGNDDEPISGLNYDDLRNLL